jgi:hypothetical protein
VSTKRVSERRRVMKLTLEEIDALMKQEGLVPKKRRQGVPVNTDALFSELHRIAYSMRMDGFTLKAISKKVGRSTERVRAALAKYERVVRWLNQRHENRKYAINTSNLLSERTTRGHMAELADGWMPDWVNVP